jgi:hypothetical protein
VCGAKFERPHARGGPVSDQEVLVRLAHGNRLEDASVADAAADEDVRAAALHSQVFSGDLCGLVVVAATALDGQSARVAGHNSGDAIQTRTFALQKCNTLGYGRRLCGLSYQAAIEK